MPADRSYVETNLAALARLKSLVERLNDEDLDRSVGHGWTVKAALAHLAFWDRRGLASLETWEREGVKIVPWDADQINDSILPEWLLMPGEKAMQEVVAAAEAVDGKAAQLSPALVAAIMAQRPRAVIRAMHRNEHLDEIEAALSR